MKVYLVSLGVGLLVGVLYAGLGVRSPAPPVVALLGLFGIYCGEQAVHLAQRLSQYSSATVVPTDADRGVEHSPSGGDKKENQIDR